MRRRLGWYVIHRRETLLTQWFGRIRSHFSVGLFVEFPSFEEGYGPSGVEVGLWSVVVGVADDACPVNMFDIIFR